MTETRTMASTLGRRGGSERALEARDGWSDGGADARGARARDEWIERSRQFNGAGFAMTPGPVTSWMRGSRQFNRRATR
jgi:hypothetical protein